MNENYENVLHFLVELRKRLLRCVIVLAIIFFSLLHFANQLYTWLALPLLKRLPHGHGLIATNIMSPFFVPFDLTFMVALFLAVPFGLYQLWMFIAPALYQREKKLIWPLLVASTLLFYVGVSFAYGVIFPILFGFLAQTVPQGVMLSPDIGQYLDLVLKLFFIFGVMFEVPVVIMLLVWSGVVTRAKLIAFRPYAIVSAFVIGMLLAPPDVFSQVILAVPLWLLYEVGIVLTCFFKR